MRRLLVIIATLYSIAVSAQTPYLEQLLRNRQVQNANVGVYIKNLNTGKVIEAYRSNNVVPPASTIKLLTTATALEIYGSGHRFETVLEYSGYIRNGVLNGNLYIKGYGDPTLGNLKDGTGFMKQWTNAVKEAGISKIEGGVVADISFFDGNALNPAWLWEDAGNYYAPGIFALSYLDNTMNIVLRSGAAGSVAEVLYIVPEVPNLQIENHIRCTQTEEDGAYVSGGPYHNFRYLTGSVPSNRGTFGVKGDIPNPGLLLAMHFTDALRKNGIETRDAAAYRSENDLIPRQRIYTHRSDTLGAIVSETNMRSVNLYAESIYRTFAQRISVPCTLNNSENFVRNFWRQRGVDLSSAIIKDGCGLAPQDAMSAETFVQLLTYMSRSREFEAFYKSLPVSGESGTLRGFLAGGVLKGRVHAKSGTISGTKNYAGYIDMPNGERWAFAILINSATGKARNIGPAIEKYLTDVYRANEQH